ncbi:fimbrial protein [Salmonella enterica]|nr:fimbrial protein [Salmonella enterica]
MRLKKRRYGSQMLWLAMGIAMSASLPASTTTLTIQGTILLPPPCVINGDAPISVSFDEVLTTRVDGSNYRKQVKYTLQCTLASSNALKMMIQGGSAGFGNGALQTSIPDLGINLETDRGTFPVNSWLNFTFPQQPTLYAVPVKRPGSTLRAAGFSAAATMIVDYQ